MDFVSQATLEAGFQPPEDCLGHDGIAQSILEKLRVLPSGSVISIQGPWGRGKTDVLARIAVASCSGNTPSGSAPTKAIWINPWQYGTPDLLSPIVIALLKKIHRKNPTPGEALWKAAESVIKAGIGFGLKATAVTLPGGKLFEVAAEEAKSLLAGLFEAHGLEQDAKSDPDPVSEMGSRFKELVNAALTSEGAARGARQLICVDDLDRCLPDRQVALLEALHFLVSAGAQATILVALDPALARQSVITHYGTDMFDPERYLDKMFDLRVSLPAVSGDILKTLIRKQLAMIVRFEDTEVSRSEFAATRCGQLFIDLEDAFDKALFLPDFCNPRMIGRILQRIYLLACSEVPFKMQINPEERWILVLWLVLIERRPEFRAAIRAAATSEEKKNLLKEMRQAYSFDTSPHTIRRYVPPHSPMQSETVEPPISEIQAERESLMLAIGMPERARAPDLCRIFPNLYARWEKTHEHAQEHPNVAFARIFADFDDLLVQAGL
jgi:hypothetical protein